MSHSLANLFAPAWEPQALAVVVESEADVHFPDCLVPRDRQAVRALRLAVFQVAMDFHLLVDVPLLGVARVVFLRLVVCPHLAVDSVDDLRPAADKEDALLAAEAADIPDKVGAADNKVAGSLGNTREAVRANTGYRSTRSCASRSRRRASACPSRSPSRNNCC